MSKRMKWIFGLMTVLVMVIAMCSCGNQEGSTDESFSGELVDAQNQRVVVRGADETILFVTTDETAYEMAEEEETLCVGDQVTVDYHMGNGMFVADTVKVTTHNEELLVFGGEISELDTNYITAKSESLSVEFEFDDATKVRGDLTEGDAVVITYSGDLSEDPYAVSVVVIQEKKEEVTKSIHGTVSETTDNSVLVSMDSSDAHRMHITKDTKITGDAKDLKVGDEVTLTYVGELDEFPAVKTITVNRRAAKEYRYVMDGIFADYNSKEVTIKTVKKNYTFKVNKDTRIENKDYMKKDHKTTITYTGQLDKHPVAVIIYCSKNKITEEEKATVIEKTETGKTNNEKAEKEMSQKEKKKTPTQATAGKDATAKAESEASKASKESVTEESEDVTKDTEEPTDPTKATEEATKAAEATKEATEAATKATEAATEATKEETKPTEPETKAPVTIRAKGTIVEWNEDTCKIKVDGNGTLSLKTKNADISSGYVPQVNDEVIVRYDKDTMDMTELQLEYRPVSAEPEAE